MSSMNLSVQGFGLISDGEKSQLRFDEKESSIMTQQQQIYGRLNDLRIDTRCQAKRSPDEPQPVVYYLPWINQTFQSGRSRESTDLELTVQALSNDQQPESLMKEYCAKITKKSSKIVPKDELLVLIGEAFRIPIASKMKKPKDKTTVTVTETVSNSTAAAATCGLCLCDITPRGFKQESRCSHGMGRHQSCVCECYCHIDPADTSLLHLAAKAGHIRVLERLLAIGEDPNSIDGYGNTPLHLAAIHGHSGVVKSLLLHKANPNICNINGNTPMHFAVKHNHLIVISLLLRHNCNVNSSNYHKQTPLHWAAQEGNQGAVRTLATDSKLAPNMADTEENSPIHLAILHAGDPATLGEILQHKKIDVNTRNMKGQTALHVAAELGRIDLVGKLLGVPRIDGNVVDNNGNTPLHLAVQNGSIEVVRELIGIRRVQLHSRYNQFLLPPISKQTALVKGMNYTDRQLIARPQDLMMDIFTRGVKPGVTVDIHARNSQGQTPLHIAITNNAGISIVNELIDSGVDLYGFDVNGNNPLHLAVARGNTVVVRTLLAAGMDSNVVNANGESPLHIAAKFNDLKMINLLLHNMANPNVRNSQGQTALHIAAAKGSPVVVSALLEQKADINIQDNLEQTPTHLMLINGHLDLAIKVIKKDTDLDINRADNKGNTFLHIASHLGSSQLITTLLNRGVSLLAQNSSGNTALHESCKHKRTDIMKQLLENAGKQGQLRELLDTNNRTGKRALHISAYIGGVQALVYMLKKGAKVNCQDENGHSALHLAALSRNSESAAQITKCLVSNGANVETRSRLGETPLHAAAKSGNADAAMTLIENGADVNAEDWSLRTPLHLAMMKGRERLSHHLISNGADLSRVTSDGDALAHSAATGGDKTSVQILINEGVSFNEKNSTGLLPIHLAAENDHAIIIDYLAEIGVDLTSVNSQGQTPLHIASLRGNQRAVEALLKAGTPIDLEDERGRTPLHYACIEGHTEVVEVLRRYGGDMAKTDSEGHTPMTLLSPSRDITTDKILSYASILSTNLSLDDYKFSPYINFVQKLDGSVATIPSLVTQANSPATYHLKLPKHEPFHGNTSSPKLKKEKKKSEKQRRKIAKDDSSQIAKLPITPVPSPVDKQEQGEDQIDAGAHVKESVKIIEPEDLGAEIIVHNNPDVIAIRATAFSPPAVYDLPVYNLPEIFNLKRGITPHHEIPLDLDQLKREGETTPQPPEPVVVPPLKPKASGFPNFYVPNKKHFKMPPKEKPAKSPSPVQAAELAAMFVDFLLNKSTDGSEGSVTSESGVASSAAKSCTLPSSIASSPLTLPEAESDEEPAPTCHSVQSEVKSAVSVPVAHYGITPTPELQVLACSTPTIQPEESENTPGQLEEVPEMQQLEEASK